MARAAATDAVVAAAPDSSRLGIEVQIRRPTSDEVVAIRISAGAWLMGHERLLQQVRGAVGANMQLFMAERASPGGGS